MSVTEQLVHAVQCDQCCQNMIDSCIPCFTHALHAGLAPQLRLDLTGFVLGGWTKRWDFSATNQTPPKLIYVGTIGTSIYSIQPPCEYDISLQCTKSPIPDHLCSAAVRRNSSRTAASVGTGRCLFNTWRSSRRRLMNRILFCTSCTCCHRDSLAAMFHIVNMWSSRQL